jgi:hypothetical protein
MKWDFRLISKGTTDDGKKGVWERFHFKNRKQLIEQSQRYVETYRDKKYDSIQSLPNRYEMPDNFIFHYDNSLKGKLFFIKRTDEKGNVNVLENHFEVDELWTHRLIRIEINLIKHIIDFYRLRKREPNNQPLIKTKNYVIINKQFKYATQKNTFIKTISASQLVAPNDNSLTLECDLFACT